MLQPQPPIPPIPPIPPVPPIPDVFAPGQVIVSNGPPEFVTIAVVSLVGIIAGGVLLLPLVRALARRLEGRAGDPALLAEVEQLRARVGELEHLNARMSELEERVDFSERLLTQAKEPQRLHAGDRHAAQ